MGYNRLRSTGAEQLVYVGEGKVGNRVTAHLKRAASCDLKGAEFLAAAGEMECSWTINNDGYNHQRLRMEKDLIEAHIMQTNRTPSAQFRG